MKFIVWIKCKATAAWTEQGDGPLTEKQAQRIASEIRRDCHIAAIVRPLGIDPNPTEAK